MNYLFVPVECIFSTITFYVPFVSEEHDMIDLSGTCFTKAECFLNFSKVSLIMDVSGIEDSFQKYMIDFFIHNESDGDLEKEIVLVKSNDAEEDDDNDDNDDNDEFDEQENDEIDDDDVYGDWKVKHSDLANSDKYTFKRSKNDFVSNFDEINTFIFAKKLRYCVVNKFSYFDDLLKNSVLSKAGLKDFFKAKVYLVGDDVFYRKVDNILSSVTKGEFVKLDAYFNLNDIYSIVPITNSNYQKDLYWITFCSDEVVMLLESSELTRKMRSILRYSNVNNKVNKKNKKGSL